MSIWCCVLEQETLLTLLQFSHILGTLWSVVNWGSSPPGCNIKGYLVSTAWDANSQPFLSHLAVLGLLWNFYVLRPLSVRPGQFTSGLLALPQEDLLVLALPRRICLHKAQVSQWCTGIPVLVQWAVIAALARLSQALHFVLQCILQTWGLSITINMEYYMHFDII